LIKPNGQTLYLSVKISKGGPSQVMEQDDGHGDGVGHKMMDQVLHIWKRRKRKKQKPMVIKAKVSNRFLFWHSRHHKGCECV
jgi:hypothetical protein